MILHEPLIFRPESNAMAHLGKGSLSLRRGQNLIGELERKRQRLLCIDIQPSLHGMNANRRACMGRRRHEYAW